MIVQFKKVLKLNFIRSSNRTTKILSNNNLIPSGIILRKSSKITGERKSILLKA
jgi:hypothetical protein